MVPGNQVVNEGANLSLPNIGQFSDPHAGGAESYTFTINWGDGMHDEGVPAMSGGAEGQPPHGSFGGAHIYADNGIYTVVVTVFADNRSASQSFQVTVNNVAPSLNVVGDQTLPLGINLSIGDLGQFTDPGFDNPANPQGEVAETFTFAIQWGDGNASFGLPGTASGGPGVASSGSFGGQHLFGAPGIYTVTATVSDDDGGSASQSFTVTVFVIRDIRDIQEALPGILFAPGGGGGSPPPRAEVPNVEVRPGVPPGINRLEFRRAGTGSVAGAEPRLVLRVVTPAGFEDPSLDELLPDEVLDNLRQLFRRLSDGHYRIYLIQPDGIEILVVDVIIQQRRNIDASDEAEGAPAASPKTDDAPAGEPAAAPADNQQSLVPPDDKLPGVTAAGLALGAGYAASVRPLRRSRLGAIGRRLDRPRFDKVRRLLRQLR
jgi:PKD repeat protein